MSPQFRVYRLIAVGCAVVSLVVCVVGLVVVDPETAQPAGVGRMESTAANHATDAEPSLSSLVAIEGSRLSDVSSHHWYGYCGSVHFFRFRYAEDADIRQLISANGFTAVQPATAATGAQAMTSDLSIWNTGMGPYWITHAAEWHSVPPTRAVFSGRVSAGHCYLFVDKPAATAYLEIAWGIP